MGLVQKFTLASSDLKTQNTGLQWSFPHIEVFTNSDEEEKSLDGKSPDEKFNESEYFEKRKSEFVIEFKKEPPKSSTQCFEVSTIISL